MLRKVYTAFALAAILIIAPIATEAIASIHPSHPVYTNKMLPDVPATPLIAIEKTVSVTTTNLKDGSKRCYKVVVRRHLDLPAHPVSYPLRC